MEPTTSIPEGNSPSTTYREFRLQVMGLPGPKGSRNRGKNGGTYEQSKIATQWQKDVALQVRSEMARVGMTTLAPPYAVSLSFCFKTPDTPKFPWPTKSDLDKLERATLDGLTRAGLIVDDKHVIASSTYKQFHDSAPCAFITVGSAA